MEEAQVAAARASSLEAAETGLWQNIPFVLLGKLQYI
jgi:hypothetical protein